MNQALVKMNVPGGILSPGELRRVVNAANYFGVEHIHIGNRQNIYLYLPSNSVADFMKRVAGLQYHFEVNDTIYPNIMTSFVTRDLVNATTWVTEGSYLEILSSFQYRPKRKISIVDPRQSMVPLFAGEMNFIASEYDNYWYLYLKFPGKNRPEQWPVLVDSEEISAIAEAIEQVFEKQPKINLIQLEVYIYNLRTWSFRMIEKPATFRPGRFLNHEGFHPMGERFWLGLYQSDNSFSLTFIDNLCMLCAQTNIGTIAITPWNSLVIKNMEERHLPLWERLLGAHGINTGHSQLELNWLISDGDKKAQEIKNYILRAFERKKLRTDAFSIGVTTKEEDLPCSILIKRRFLVTFWGISLFSSYEVKYRKGFDPNSHEQVAFADGLKKRNLAQILSYLSSLYYDELINQSIDPSLKLVSPPVMDNEGQKKFREVYQCKNCLTVYDPIYGDESAGIKPNTAFKSLPVSYKCSLCESDKEAFHPANMEELYVSVK